MSTFNIPTLDDQHGFLIQLFKALLPTRSVQQGSFNWLWLRTLAGAVTDNHSHETNVEGDLLPDTASGDMEDRWGTILGVPRKGATPSQGNTCLRVFGNVGAAVPSLSQMTHVSGLIFQINGAFVVGAAGYVDCNLTAVSTGSATNLNAGETLTFSATPTGLQDNAILQPTSTVIPTQSLTQGFDNEQDGPYQQRIAARLSNPPLGGAQSDYVAWALTQLGIASAYAYPGRAGLGSVDVAGLHSGSGASRVPLAGELATLLTLLTSLKPVAAAIRVLTPITQTVDIEYMVLPDGSAASAFDWDDTTPGTVLAWTGATNTLQFQGGVRPPNLAAGMRLTIKPVAGGGTGQQFVVQSLSGADSVVLSAAPVPAPVNGDTVYSGGPLVDPARAAIQAIVDGLGTANPDATRYGAWEGNLRPGAIDRAVRSIAGALDGTVIAPGAIVTATDYAYPNDSQIGLLIAGHILVRRQH